MTSLPKRPLKPMALVYMRTRSLPLREEMKLGLAVASLYTESCPANVYVAIHGESTNPNPFAESMFYEPHLNEDVDLLDFTDLTDGTENQIVIESIRFAKRAGYSTVCLIHDDCWLRYPVTTLGDAQSLVDNPNTSVASVSFAAGGCTVFKCSLMEDYYLDNFGDVSDGIRAALMHFLGGRGFTNAGLTLMGGTYSHGDK